MRRNTDLTDAGNNDTMIFASNNEFLERFDSRGKKMKLRRGQITQPPL